MSKLSEEEKKAIEYLKVRLYGNEGCELIDVAQSDLRIIIKLVDRVLKDDKNWQEIYDDQEENIREKNNKICEFEFIIEKQQKEIEGLQTKVDTGIEIIKQEKEKNNNLIKQLQEQNTEIQDISRQLRQEKEKNKELEKYEEAYKLLSYGLNNYISKDKIIKLLENETIDISGFRCIAVEDIENLLEEK